MKRSFLNYRIIAPNFFGIGSDRYVNANEMFVDTDQNMIQVTIASTTRKAIAYLTIKDAQALRHALQEAIEHARRVTFGDEEE